MYLYLAQSGGSVFLPTVVDVRDVEERDQVAFVDASGGIVAVFRRSDVATYSMKAIDASEESTE